MGSQPPGCEEEEEEEAAACWNEAEGWRRGRGGVRAESAGSSANRRGSSVNGVNEEWEQSKCAEMREVPPRCIGRRSVWRTDTTRHHAHAFSAPY